MHGHHHHRNSGSDSSLERLEPARRLASGFVQLEHQYLDMGRIGRACKTKRLLGQQFSFVFSFHRQQELNPTNYSREFPTPTATWDKNLWPFCRFEKIDQASLGLSKQYLDKGIEEPFVKAYHEYQVNLAVLFGASIATATAEMAEVLDFEMKLANVSLSFGEEKVIKRWTSIFNLFHFPSCFTANLGQGLRASAPGRYPWALAKFSCRPTAADFQIAISRKKINSFSKFI